MLDPRHSLEFVYVGKIASLSLPALRMIYRAKDADAGKAALDAFDAGPWGPKKIFRHRAGLAAQTGTEADSPSSPSREAVRRIIYTTNAIEALNAKLRRAVKIRGHFPNDEAATKLIYLVLRQTATEWKMSQSEWGEAKTQFAIMFEDRFHPGMMVNPAPHTRNFLIVPAGSSPHRFIISGEANRRRCPSRPGRWSSKIEVEGVVSR